MKTKAHNKQNTIPAGAELKNVLLSEIQIGKNNPRKTFPEAELIELKESIRVNGLAQAITLRLVNGKPELVCGERRYRASLMIEAEDKTRNTILAVVHSNMSDAQAMELQLVENLHRENVPPMEEAKGFKRLLDAKKCSVEELALKVGKSVAFIAQRLKLNDLIEPFQECLEKGILNLKGAFLLCKLSGADQKTIWQENYQDDFANEELEEIEISENRINRYLCDLTDAPFDTTDKSLIKKAGACTGCPFNTANNAVLFPELAEEAHCTNSACYNKKAFVSFEKQLNKALETPGVELISTEYGDLDETATLLQEKGHRILSRREFRLVDEPTEPKLSDFQEELEQEYYETEADMQAAYDEAVSDYKQELAEYEELKLAGKFVRGFIVQGNQVGSFIDVAIGCDSKEEKAAPSAKEFQEKVKGQSVTIQDIEAEMARLNQSEARKRELDEEKVQPLFYELLKDNTRFADSKGHLSDTENAALLLALIDFGGYKLRDMADFLIKPKEEHSCEELNLYHSFLVMDREEQNDTLKNLLRWGIIEKFRPYTGARPDKSAKAQCVKSLAYEYSEEGATAIWEKQMEARQKREAKLSQRIEELNERKAGLERVGQLQQEAA